MGNTSVGGMLVVAVLGYVVAVPYVAVASLVAFLMSELGDWYVYTFTKRPLAQRILISSAISTPIDSAVFLEMIGHFSWLGFAMMTAAKMLAAGAIWWRIK